MPTHIIKKEDEVPTETWLEILTLAGKLDFSRAYLPLPPQHWLQCVLAIDWITGKRINEILSLRRKAIIFTKTQIRIKFFVGKKRSRGTPLELQPYQKARNIRHKAVPFIKKYLAEYDKKFTDKEGYLFPSKNSPRTRTVHTTFINGKGEQETREYIYTDPEGYIRQENARFWLGKINDKLPPKKRFYFHYGRHNIGIKLAYQGKSDIEIARVLDETPRAAIKYTEHASGLESEWTNETE